MLLEIRSVDWFVVDSKYLFPVLTKIIVYGTTQGHGIIGAFTLFSSITIAKITITAAVASGKWSGAGGVKGRCLGGCGGGI